MKSKIFITGASGFIGRNICEQLKVKYSIHAPTSRELDLLSEEEVSRYLKKGRFDVVIHAATWNATRNSQKDLSLVLGNNLRMFFNLARNRHLYRKMICYGSGAEYDRRHWIPKMKEEYFDTYLPRDDYGFSKYIISKHIRPSGNIYNLRLFGVFGKYEDWEIRFISNACCKAAYNLPITIKQNVLFDYMYIDDLVRITEWFIKNNPREKIFNVCTGKTYSLLELARIILAAEGKKPGIRIAKKGLGREYSGDNRRLLAALGKFKFSEMDESVKTLYRWYASRKSLIKKNRLLWDK